MARANIFEEAEVDGIAVYFGSGVDPANSPAQFFVAWGMEILKGGLVHTYNSEGPDQGILWFVDEDEAEDRFNSIRERGIGV